MKYLVSLILVLLLSGCAEDTIVESGHPDSTLILSKKQISLSDSLSIDSAVVKLSCGCAFDLTVVRYEGDTSAIKFKTHEIEDITAHTMAIVFESNPNVSPGNYSIVFVFRLTKRLEPGVFSDTITVDYVKQ